MHRSFFVCCISVCCLLETPSFAQSDETIVQDIHRKGNYVQLTDESDLPPIVRPYLTVISSYLQKQQLRPEEYWLDTSCVVISDAGIELPVYHFDGFKRQWQDEAEMRAVNASRATDEPQWVISHSGNASGKDGYLLIDPGSETVIRFSIWL